MVPAGLGAPIYSKLDSEFRFSYDEYKCSQRSKYRFGMNSAQLSGEENQMKFRKTK